MMYIVRPGLRERNDPIGLGITELTPAKPDFKFAQVDFSQDNRRSTNYDFLFRPVDGCILKFVRQRTEFIDQIPQGGNLWLSFDRGDLVVTGS